jgi:hypothetical protein
MAMPWTTLLVMGGCGRAASRHVFCRCSARCPPIVGIRKRNDRREVPGWSGGPGVGSLAWSSWPSVTCLTAPPAPRSSRRCSSRSVAAASGVSQEGWAQAKPRPCVTALWRHWAASNIVHKPPCAIAAGSGRQRIAHRDQDRYFNRSFRGYGRVVAFWNLHR